ncbi:TetR/AcrR family transcriptional regulator [Pedobacter boryungensis]|uniref:TetR/AcrR family transcriptional regulator n=1 Tax=Pedobacter boryungensis TaxID=869962 RepID=A0ABX2DDD1_9SPHI|nr:TetR/AcrR family transcriptional regulator [Pedobacter boryungensis]NQX32075.1 TetR/AcrR family transcriptional regulator [Pedobacter boryungensis]
MEVKEYIIAEADKLFCQYGFKSVTMDDIAKHLGMSKKTIYQHFRDKDELVNILIEDKLANQDCANNQFVDKAKDAVHEIFFSLSSMHELLGNMNPKLFYDLQKYHPKAWLYFKNFKEKSMSNAILKNLERGIAEGIYREDLNKEILTQLRLDHVELIFSQHDHYTKGKYTIAQVMIEITEHFLYGICNQKGLEKINYYKQQLSQV